MRKIFADALRRLASTIDIAGNNFSVSTHEHDMDERDLLAAIVRSSDDAIISKTLDGIITSWNSGAEKMFGYRAAEVIGQSIRLIIPQDRINEENDIIARLRAGETIQHFDTVRVAKNGRLIDISLTVSPVHNKSGKIVGASKLVRDITERRKAELQRQKLVDKLMRSNSELERFTYTASHDMREPLRMIKNFSGLIQEEYHSRLDDQGRAYLRIMMDSSARIEIMVNELLDYARLGKETMRFVRFDANKELQHVLENLASLIKDSSAVVSHDPLPQIEGNPVQFIRLMQNLIGNGIKYQASGSKPRVHVGCVDLGDQWQLTVSDNGIGIAESDQKSIFEPFHRLHSWDEFKGTGLGLAICTKIVENHGGRLSVTSTIGQGSRFDVLLPKQLKKERGR